MNLSKILFWFLIVAAWHSFEAPHASCQERKAKQQNKAGPQKKANPQKKAKDQKKVKEYKIDFVHNTIGPETLLPLDMRGYLQLRWPQYKRHSRFEFKPNERPIYRIYISPEGIPASKGRVHVTYDNCYPLTNLFSGEKYNILVDVEQNGAIVHPEKAYKAKSIKQNVKWYVAPRAAGGNPANPGSYTRPVDITFVNGSAGPGDIVVLKSGIYLSPSAGVNKNIHDTKLHPARSGRPGAHILFLAESNDLSKKERVSFQTAWGNINVNKTDYALFDGLNCDSDQGQNAKALTAIMGEYGHRPTGVIVRNIYYHAMTTDKQIMVNTSREVLIENCYFGGSLESHNVYICNNTQSRPEYADSRGIFRNNVCMNATRNNVHANGFFDNFIIENNIMIGAKVANISLATVHRNSHVRNNIAYEGAKQAITVNFYASGTPMEEKEPSANVHICHNTLIVSENTDYAYAPIIVSDTRRMPYRHVIEGLYIKNNILATERKSSRNVLINMCQARHLSRMEVKGNLGFSLGDQWGYFGEVNLPIAGSSQKAWPFTFFEQKYKENATLKCIDSFRDGADREQYTEISQKVGPWSDNKMTQTLDDVFVDLQARDFRLSKSSPALKMGVNDKDTRRIIRDIYGNIRRPGRVDVGAIVGGCDKKITTLVSEYRLMRGPEVPPGGLVPGQRTLAASVQLKLNTKLAAILRRLIVEFEVAKKDRNSIVVPQQDLIVEVLVNNKAVKPRFYKPDKAGNEKVWLEGWVENLTALARNGETIDIKVYVTVASTQKINSITTTFAHDNIFGLDAHGRKVAVTEHNSIGFGQSVAP